MKQFLKEVWGNREGWAYIGAKNHSLGEGGWYQEAFKYPDDLNKMVKVLEEKNASSSVYFCPHLFRSEGRRIKENSLPTRYLWVDKDGGHLTDLEPRPSICWQTSDGKWQVLWKLNDPLEVDRAEVLNRKLAVSTKGDRGCWNAGRFLRLPGSINHKYSPPYHGISLWQDDLTYDVKEFVDMTVDIDDLTVNSDADKPMPRKIPSYSDALVAYGNLIPTNAWKKLREKPKSEKEWSENLWQLERLLIKAGVPLVHVFAIVKGSPWNKYERDGRPDAHLWKEVCKADAEKNDITPEDDLEDLPWMTLDNLLLYAEKPKWLVEDIWMEKNVGWIAGEGKSYKSVMSLDLALSVASGKPFLGKFQVNEPGPVLMVQEEDPVWRVAHRIQAMADAKGITDVDVAFKEDSLTLNLKDTGIPLFISIGGKLTFEDENRMAALERAIATRRPKMVILDPMFMLSAGMDEFKAGEMAGILNQLKHWRNEYECSIAVVHHFRKSTGADTQKLYGSMALYAWSENSLLVQRESRDNNLVSIRRDIKDAPSEDTIGVEFVDIDETYEFKLRDMESDSPQTAMIKAIRENDGGQITLKDFQDSSGLNDKRARQVIKDLQEDGFIKVDRKGKGGIIHMKLTDPVFKGEVFI